jgi:hypothetical protein
MRFSPMRAVVVIGLVVGAVERVVVWRSDLGTLDGDEAVWGLMARHVLDGEIPTFFWGQGYGGTLEVLLSVPLLAVAPTSVVALRAVPVLLTLVAVYLVWRVGRRTVGEPAATAAAVLFWVWPSYAIWKSIRAHGFYASGLVLCLLVLLLVLRLAEQPSRRDAILLGFVLGLAGWQTFQILPVAVGALGWLAWKRTGVVRDLPYALAAALVGFLPWIVSNLANDWWTFDFPPGGGTYLSRFRGSVNGSLPMAFGVRVPFDQGWIGGFLVGGCLFALTILVLAWFGVRRLREPFGLLVVVAVVFPFLMALSTFTWLVDEPRYVYILTPVIALLVGSLLTTWPRLLAGLGAATALSVAGLVIMHGSDQFRERADGLAVPADFRPLIDELDRRGISRVYADYWVAYRLAFESGERIIAAQSPQEAYRRDGGRVIVVDPGEMRRPQYDTIVREAGRPGHVVVRGTPDQRKLDVPLLRAAGYRESVVGDFVVWGPP